MNRLALTWFLFLAVVAVFVTGCPPRATPTPLTPRSPLAFTTLEQSLGHMPYFYDKAPRLVVIASSKEAQTDVPLYLYPEFQRPNDPGDTVNQIRRTDFSRYFVAAVFQGYGAAGIRVSRIWQEPDRVVIEARFEQGPSDKTPMQSPYHVLRVARQGVPEGTKVSFVIRDETGLERASTDHVITASLPATPGPTPTFTPALTPRPTSTPFATPMRRPPTPTHTPYPTYVDISMVPSRQRAHLWGNQFQVKVQVDAGGQPVAGVDAFLDFNPEALEVVSVRGGETMPVLLANHYDNETGRIDFGAGFLGSKPPTGRFVLATIEFKTKNWMGVTLISFSTADARHTDAAYSGLSVLRSVTDAVVEIW